MSAMNDLTATELAAIAKLSPLPAPPPDSTNRHADDPKAALLGQKLFFDKSTSGALAIGDDGTNGGLGNVGETGKVACASCHSVGSPALSDLRSLPGNVSLGADYGTRNALGLVNSAFYQWTNWGGRFDSQWSLPLAVVESPKNMNITRLQLVHILYAKYRAEYDATFAVPLDAALDPKAVDAARFPISGKPGDAAWNNMAAADQGIVNTIFVNYGKAMQAYLRTLVSRNAPFDQFVAGHDSAISESAVRGLKLFLAKGCVSCHSGSHFSDGAFHALAVPQTGPHVPASDLGLYQDVPALLASPFNTNGSYSDDQRTGKLDGLVQVASQKGMFRTKSLRNLVGAAPYMHAGQLATLEDVVTFYDQGGGDPGTLGIVKDPRLVPLGLSAQDKIDLVAFLKTLTGDPIAENLVVDTSK
jgi:cytochrome c peroxidase